MLIFLDALDPVFARTLLNLIPLLMFECQARTACRQPDETILAEWIKRSAAPVSARPAAMFD